MNKNLKKLILTFLTAIFLLSPYQVNASELLNFDIRINEKIDKLYEERLTLSIDMVKNIDRINEIDNELILLGIEEISESEVKEKFSSNGEVMPLVSTPTSSTIKWTSVRQKTVYNGTEYEVQIIRGVPKPGVSSELCDTDAQFLETESGLGQATSNVFKILTPTILGLVPELGAGVSATATFYDLYKGVIDGLSRTSSVGSVSATFTTSLVSNYLYVWIKHYGAVDANNQILAYKGNQVMYETTIVIPSTIVINGTTVRPSNRESKVIGTISSPYYNGGYIGESARIMWYYKNQGLNINGFYHMQYIYLTLLNDVAIRIPTPYPLSGW